MKNPGFIPLESNAKVSPIDQNANDPSPLTAALQKRRKNMASKRMAPDPNQQVDSLGNPIEDENSDK